MKLSIYSIYDSAVMAYTNPFVMQTDAQAIRAFADNVNDEKSQMNKHPEQFTLFRIARFDDSKGIVENDSKALGKANEYKVVERAPRDEQLVDALYEIEGRLSKIEQRLDPEVAE